MLRSILALLTITAAGSPLWADDNWPQFRGTSGCVVAKGAIPETWDQKNKQGWTPLTIAEGYRFGNYKPSPVTVAALHQVMKAAGVNPPVRQ